MPPGNALLVYLSAPGSAAHSAVLPQSAPVGYHLQPRAASGSSRDAAVPPEDILVAGDLAFLRRTPTLIIADGTLGAGRQRFCVSNAPGGGGGARLTAAAMCGDDGGI